MCWIWRNFLTGKLNSDCEEGIYFDSGQTICFLSTASLQLQEAKREDWELPTLASQPLLTVVPQYLLRLLLRDQALQWLMVTQCMMWIWMERGGKPIKEIMVRIQIRASYIANFCYHYLYLNVFLNCGLKYQNLYLNTYQRIKNISNLSSDAVSRLSILLN